MTKKKRTKMIIELLIIFALCNFIFISNVNNPNRKVESDLTISEPQRDVNDTFYFEKENTLGSILGLDHNYFSPNDPLIVKPIDLANSNSKEDNKIGLINTTDFKVDLEALLNRTFITNQDITNEPLVLIIHTHGTESFVPDNKNYYFIDTSFNSTDITKNIVAVGDEFCKVLEENGVPFIHEKTMFDENSYRLSYKNSGIAVSEYLKEYPSIKYVIDMHRDTICDKNNINQKPLTTINGEKTAQIMFVVGTNAGGANHPNWKDNLTVVLKYQEIITRKYPSLARPIYLHTSSFNQFNMPTMMLLEVGASGNTLDEAKNAARYSAECFIELIKTY